MREKVLASYQNAMRQRGWYFVRLYPWRVRIAKYPLHTVWYALADRFWQMVVTVRQSPFITMRTFWGQKLKAPFPDYRSLLHHGLLDARELPVEDYLVQHLTKNDVFFDVGANIGFYSALALALGASAHAFEPTPRTYSILSANVPNATLVNLALMDTEGEVSFTDLGAEQAGSNSVAIGGGGTITVPATTLDAYCKKLQIYPTCIKMDVEKAEWQVLMGAKEVLARHPTLLVETGERRVIELMLSMGYKAYHFDHAASGAVMPYTLGDELRSANMLFI